MVSRIFSNIAARRDARLEPLESRCMLSAQTALPWLIHGDINGSPTDDVIIVQLDPNNANLLQAVINDTVVGTKNISGVSEIRIRGGGGNDNISINLPDTLTIPTKIFGGNGNDTLLGSTSNDWIDGGNGNDTLNGRGGDDFLHGGSGTNTINGTLGKNVIDASGQNDLIFTHGNANKLINAKMARVVTDTATQTLSLADEQALHDWFISAALGQWGGQLGQATNSYGWWPPITMQGNNSGGSGGGNTTNSSGNTSSDASGGNYSTTNNQVAGVNEPDTALTDGKNLYVIAGDGIDIFQASDTGTLTKLSHFTLPGMPQSLLLVGDKLVGISSEYSPMYAMNYLAMAGTTNNTGIAVMPGGYWPGYQWTPPKLNISIIDITQSAAPVLVQQTSFEGSLVDARAINGQLWLVLDSNVSIPSPAIILDPTAPGPGSGGGNGGGGSVGGSGNSGSSTGSSGGVTNNVSAMMPIYYGGQSGHYEDLAAYTARLEAAWTAGVLPTFTATDADGKTLTASLAQAGHTYLPVGSDLTSLLSIVQLNMDATTLGPAAITTLVAPTWGTVYSTANHLYFATTDWNNTSGTATNIYEFDLTDPTVPLMAMGSVPGSINDQFSLDEYQGSLRVATTKWNEQTTSSGIFVLQRTGDQLSIVGSLTNLAPGESIYSVRFEGALGYVTTFHQIDPLWTIDLSDPLNPQVLGELKVPGFSTYIQSIDATHLLAIGRDVDPVTNHVLGLELSLFDVSDPAHPTLAASYLFGGNAWDSWSPAQWDHHALSYFADQHILALPMSASSITTDPTTGTSTFSNVDSLDVLSIDPVTGFTLLGAVQHDAPVQRSLRISDLLYSISVDQVKVTIIDQPSQVLDAQPLTAPIWGGGPFMAY